MATNVASQLAQIKKQKEALLKKEQALMSKSHDKVLAQIVKLAKDAGLTASDITSAMNAGKPVKTKTAICPWEHWYQVAEYTVSTVQGIKECF